MWIANRPSPYQSAVASVCYDRHRLGVLKDRAQTQPNVEVSVSRITHVQLMS
jgi:hypothetical protein